MSRVLFFVLLAIVVYMIVRSMKRRSGGSARPPGPAIPEAMVSCATCGLHLPRGEALLLGDRYFCCEEHRRRPPAA